MATRHVIGKVDDFAPGSVRVVEIGGRSVGVFRVGDRFYALRNRCPHQGGPLCEGPVVPALEAADPETIAVAEGRWRVACPWHNWEYDLETGRSWFDPERSRVRNYPVDVGPEPEAGPGPYVAETYDVAADGDSVIVEV